MESIRTVLKLPRKIEWVFGMFNHSREIFEWRAKNVQGLNLRLQSVWANNIHFKYLYFTFKVILSGANHSTDIVSYEFYKKNQLPRVSWKRFPHLPFHYAMDRWYWLKKVYTQGSVKEMCSFSLLAALLRKCWSILVIL